ncbi:MerR family transcriptional regulator [Spongiactinospora sp. TRM90649]|uniref:helix-turn-helix domain-containing protein n=1 Tax=Spongiactinospora sp. TRM90649 TaxID=3031114 RepID=UPI0023F74844|nr:MerR family transcriptional regulator [Spongiactinospora sp. TRM90649]MDF5758890.1 MerR family transcriptional regulator [Spongiactinospora sp. TRM90649]
MKSSAYLRIGELAERFDLAPHVLRHWEAMGLLTPADRVSGRRRYTRDHVIRVLTIIRAKAGGMSLEQIREVLSVSGGAERHELLRRHHADLERRLAEITASKALVEHLMRCTAEDFTRCPDYRRIAEGVAGPHEDGCVV